MKLQYLVQVEKLLEDYDYPDKYKIMLELEESLSRLEINGEINTNLLVTEFGTPSEYVSKIIKSKKTPTNSEGIEKSNQVLKNNTTNNKIDKSQTKKKVKQEHNNKHTIDKHKSKTDKQKSKTNLKKFLSIILYAILSIICFIIVAITIISSIEIYPFLGGKLTLAFFLSIIFLLIAFILFLLIFKEIYKIIFTRKTKYIDIILLIINCMALILLALFLISYYLESLVPIIPLIK